MGRSVKVACLLGEGFEDSEFRKPYDALRQAGHVVDIIGTKAGEHLEGKQGKEDVKADKGIGDVRPEDYDLLFIPGGYSPDHLRHDTRFVDFVRAFDDARRPIAAVCHGPQLMMSAGIVHAGRKLTAWDTVQSDLRYTGAEVEDQPVVIDGNWVTSRKPDDLEQFSRAMLSAVQ
ncbi:type 1 glutamine amidotransferase [Archangium violaceum]|uniref:type 1 glutamine amidotransferase domain-containing protein n=1 Tax=Archangium violaceum TaxID=83451 RepID=UPI00193C51DE|nr:type 1 glutamine amidotransferase domain-containing protein [Archangium violaceum]QRK10002.1 type 1 glutamine amidotransferase [Archangium violaceum]